MTKSATQINFTKISETIQILAQPLRLEIISMLNESDKVCVCVMVEKFKIKQNLVSHHLGMLKRIGIVDTERDGVRIFYSLNKDKYQQLQKDLKILFGL